MFDTLKWRSFRTAHRADLRDGGAYTIARWGNDWVVHYLPTGRPDGGVQRVEWLPGRRTLATAKTSCEAHAATITPTPA